MPRNPPVTAARLRARMKELRCEQDDLAAGVGITQSAVSQILTGKVLNSRHLPAIAAHLAVNLDWLSGRSDVKIVMFNAAGDSISENDLALLQRQLGEPQAIETSVAADQLGLVAVRELDLTFGMGATYLEVPVTSHVRYFSHDWIRTYTQANPDNLMFAAGVGDSMAPTILDSDLLLIDASQQSIRLGDKIWAIAFGEVGMVKRLRPMPDGSVAILSDNPLVPETRAVDGEMSVLGRVVAAVRKI
jgi:phage repressor protein C with HTH and peptisase S24 domain